jgi:hypothetical protein
MFNPSYATGTKVAAYALADFLNRNTRTAFPGDGEWARKAGVHISTVRRARDELAGGGDLKKERAGGNGLMIYAPIVKEIPTAQIEHSTDLIERSSVHHEQSSVHPSVHASVHPQRGPVESPKAYAPNPSNPSNPGENSKVATPSAPRRATRLPADWTLSDVDCEYALSNSLNGQQINREVEAFRDYWHAKATNATKLDWSATWRTWVRRSTERLPQHNLSTQGVPHGGSQRQSGSVVEAARRLTDKLRGLESLGPRPGAPLIDITPDTPDLVPIAGGMAKEPTDGGS